MPIKYRNTLRSKALNKEVLIELLKKKPTRKIIVTDNIKSASISRRTFYDTLLRYNRFVRKAFKKNFGSTTALLKK